jgi:hypothetical protein
MWHRRKVPGSGVTAGLRGEEARFAALVERIAGDRHLSLTEPTRVLDESVAGPVDLPTVLSLSRAGDTGVALEILLDSLRENEVRLSPALSAELLEYARGWDLKPRYWRYLEPG